MSAETPEGWDHLLDVRGLRTFFFTEAGVVKAVDDISFRMARGEVLGLVGESGCGKTVASLALMRLVPPPGRIVGGEILFKGRDLLALPEPRMRELRGAEIAMVFQEPASALNPVFTIGYQVAEALIVHGRASKKEALKEAGRMLREVAIPDPDRRLKEYPHQLSGGMRQRVMIAMALICEPSLLIADEPTTALDVTIQAQILDLLQRMREKYHLTVLLITHDLGVVAELADRVAVMYAGRIVEIGRTVDVFDRAAHPYTRALLRCLPDVDSRRRRLVEIGGQPPDLASLPPGCPFAPRCAERQPRCASEYPPSVSLGPGHVAHCWVPAGAAAR